MTADAVAGRQIGASRTAPLAAERRADRDSQWVQPLSWTNRRTR